MNLEELAQQYYHQYEVLNAHIEGLKPLLKIYRGEDNLKLRKKIKVYRDMAYECMHTYQLLLNYYKED